MLSISQFQFLDPDGEISVTIGDLPHWQQTGATYFITYRLADSISQQAHTLIMAKRDDWLRRHGIDPLLPRWQLLLTRLPDQQRSTFRRLFATAFETELDKLSGDCVLRTPEVQQIVSENLRHFDGQRYQLGGFVVMPNHVHVLARVFPEREMLTQCYNWKHYQACQINKVLGQAGHLFQPESFDHIVRDGENFVK